MYFFTKDKDIEQTPVPTDTFVLEETEAPILFDESIKIEEDVK